MSSDLSHDDSDDESSKELLRNRSDLVVEGTEEVTSGYGKEKNGYSSSEDDRRKSTSKKNKHKRKTVNNHSKTNKSGIEEYNYSSRHKKRVSPEKKRHNTKRITMKL